ncbi:MAG: ribose 5-phosphate isomerase B [Bacteroidetes bacterium]|nr:ribose 5-phosphate isomerase B [Bacteroidota bacterium]
MNNKIFSHIHIGSDHAGFKLKEELKKFLANLGYTITDHGTYSEESTDYPDYAHPLASAVETNQGHGGILICGSGNGVCMTANKHAHIRAALCWTKEIAELARLHNNANVICLPARFVTTTQAEEMVSTFLSTAFEGGRHERRVEKI